MPHAQGDRPVLVVDDDPDIREALRMALESEGFPVETAANGQEALDALRRGPPPRCVLLDLMMPVMDGYAFLEEQAKDRATARVPVAVVTAGHHLDRARLHGAPVYTKPVDLDVMVDAIRSLSDGPPTPP